MSDVVERLNRSITTAQNDDTSAPQSLERKRHNERSAAMQDAAAEILALLAEVVRLSIAAQSWQNDFIQENQRLSKAKEEIERLNDEAIASYSRAIEDAAKVATRCFPEAPYESELVVAKRNAAAIRNLNEPSNE